MVEVQVYHFSGSIKGSLTLPGAPFGSDYNEHLVYEASKAYLANQRLSLASTKKRSEVRGGGRKPFRQKGTGRSRQGTRRSPLMPGGGITFGPKPRSHHIFLPPKIRRSALLSILSARAHEGAVCVIELPEQSPAKTKRIHELLKALGMERKRCLLILHKPDKEIQRASSNIPYLWVEDVKSLTTFPVIWAEKVIFSEGAVEQIRMNTLG